jgi:hypothetical protein
MAVSEIGYMESKRMRAVLGALLVAATMIAVPRGVSAAPLVITFDSLTAFDAETDANYIQPLATQFASDGVEFTSGWAWFAFFSLNETDYPPQSYDTVASNATRDSAGALILGTIDIAFTQAFYTVGGFFTYDGLLTLEAFNGLNSLGIVNSPSSSNIGTSDFVQFAAALPITRLLITSAGTQFTLDDLTLTSDAPVQTAVPEPGSMLLLGGGLATLWRQRARRRR